MVASKKEIQQLKIHNNQKQKQKKNNMHYRLFSYDTCVFGDVSP